MVLPVTAYADEPLEVRRSMYRYAESLCHKTLTRDETTRLARLWVDLRLGRPPANVEFSVYGEVSRRAKIKAAEDKIRAEAEATARLAREVEREIQERPYICDGVNTRAPFRQDTAINGLADRMISVWLSPINYAVPSYEALADQHTDYCVVCEEDGNMSWSHPGVCTNCARGISPPDEFSVRRKEMREELDHHREMATLRHIDVVARREVGKARARQAKLAEQQDKQGRWAEYWRRVEAARARRQQSCPV